MTKKHNQQDTINTTLKKSILLVCPKCQSMRISERAKWDEKKAVYVKIECPDCNKSDRDGDVEYYGDKGEILIL